MKIESFLKNILLLTSLSFLFYSCEKESDEDIQFPSSEFICDGTFDGDYWPTDGWRTCHPDEVGMDAEMLKELNDEIVLLIKSGVEVHNALIVKNGYIVAEQYYSDYIMESLHPIYSCTKSITSALMGIAMDEGYIESLDEKMVDHFSEYEIENLTTEKENINLEQLLEMSAGLEWFELEYPYDNPQNTFYQWVGSDNLVKFVLDQPMISVPGDEYSYNTGISHLISAIIQNSTGIRTDLYAKEKIFAPLGIENYQWEIDPQGYPFGGHTMKLTPRDMAKFGYLYLKNGKWDDLQIVPEDWIETSTDAHIQRKYVPDFHYGYHWWVKENEYFAAVGAYGQWIYIVPEHELVVVFTNDFSENEDLQVTSPERLLNTYIIPAVE